MKNLKDLLKVPLLSIVFISILTSCVKDVELNQIEEIQLTPTAVIDLLDFTLEADLLAFEQQEAIGFDKEVSFEVITDDLKQNVTSVDLVFDSTNSLPRKFHANLYFMTDRNYVNHIISFDILPGSKEIPEVSTFVETFEGETLNALNKSSKIKIRMEMEPGPGATEGQFQLISTAAYNFEF